MRLVIIDDQGNIHEVTEGIDEYNLNKPMPRAEIADNVRDALAKIPREEKNICIECGETLPEGETHDPDDCI